MNGMQAMMKLIRQKNARIAELEAENAALRRGLMIADVEQNRADREVFRMVKEKPKMSAGCARIVAEV